jgi:hypothetical protein
VHLLEFPRGSILVATLSAKQTSLLYSFLPKSAG